MRKDNSGLNKESLGRIVLRSGFKIGLLFVILVATYSVLLGYLVYVT